MAHLNRKHVTAGLRASDCNRLLQWDGKWVAGLGAEWTLGLRTKSHFIPNQALKSVPILGTRSTTAFTFSKVFRLHDNIWLVYRWKSPLSLSGSWMLISRMPSQFASRCSHLRNASFILMIKPQSQRAQRFAESFHHINSISCYCILYHSYDQSQRHSHPSLTVT